jgi:hypothetical protein
MGDQKIGLTNERSFAGLPRNARVQAAQARLGAQAGGTDRAVAATDDVSRAAFQQTNMRILIAGRLIEN